MYPFDDIFTPERVAHKPALGSRYGLVNLTKRRFIFWDDFSPVEFAHEMTVTKATFLSLFIGQSSEIQAPQNSYNGNPDVAWKRGVVFTAKYDGLWNPTKRITEEDVTHMRNRCDEFCFQHVFDRASIKEVIPCAHHMAEWIVEGAAEYEAASRPLLPLVAPGVSEGGGDSGVVQGFGHLMNAASIPKDMQNMLRLDLQDLGAVAIAELSLQDWEGLPCWANLRPLQRRRLLQQALGPTYG